MEGITRRGFILGAVEVLTIPKSSMPRAQCECELMDSLRQDVRDLHVGMVNWKLRQRIRHLMAELSRQD